VHKNGWVQKEFRLALSAYAESENMAESNLRAALEHIKHKTRALYPAIARCVESGVDRTEAMSEPVLSTLSEHFMSEYMLTESSRPARL
jgi:hypothetical protein